MSTPSAKTALITGANKGIGLEIARQLGRQGFYIFLGSRNQTRGEQAWTQLQKAGIQGKLLIMDVGDNASIQQAFQSTQKQVSSLDVLINNAGILLDQGENILSVSDSDFTQTLQVNAIGAFQIVRTFLPLLTRGSRIIMVSSGAGIISGGVSSFAPVYAVSKTLMNTLTQHLARDLGDKGIAINAVSPGWVQTDMGGAGASRSVEKGAETPVWLATEAPIELTGKFFHDKKEIEW